MGLFVGFAAGSAAGLWAGFFMGRRTRCYYQEWVQRFKDIEREK